MVPRNKRMQDEFEAFLINPTRDAYECAREALLSDSAFQVNPRVLAVVVELCAAGEYVLELTAKTPTGTAKELVAFRMSK